MKKVTIDYLKEKKTASEKITMLTAYDFATSQLLDKAGVDIILVGDSLGMVALGYETTLPVTLGEMLHHTKAVTRGAKRAFVVGDMPFMTYQTSINKAVKNAGKFLKEAGANGVKIEGGKPVVEKIKAMVEAGIPVMGHLGLTPQSINMLGGYKTQGKTNEEARALMDNALSLQAAGVFSIVLECVPASLGKQITEALNIPIIGIGAGPLCDGQVLVTDDLLGKFEKVPKFAKKYLNMYELASKAINEFINDVHHGKFPEGPTLLG